MEGDEHVEMNEEMRNGWVRDGGNEREKERKKKKMGCVSWYTLSPWCSPGYSSVTQSTVHE